NYADPDGKEEEILKIIKEAADLTSFSDELSENCRDWVSSYHLSAVRANVLRPFTQLLRDAHVLEIGSGCGAITRFLGENSRQVTALEGTYRRSAITRLRTRDLDNVKVYCEDFNFFASEEKYDVATLIGVLEYAGCFSKSEEPAQELLARANHFLKDDGTLIIAIENKLGLKYFAGFHEDHIGKQFYGIEDRYKKGEARTYGLYELRALLMRAGFEHTHLFIPLPDYKFPISILSEGSLDHQIFNGGEFAWQSVKSDRQIPANLNFDLGAAWRTVFENKLAIELGKPIFVLAKKKKIKKETCLSIGWD
ncbi:methyltransferase, partial [Nostoc sp. NIES-2111]